MFAVSGGRVGGKIAMPRTQFTSGRNPNMPIPSFEKWKDLVDTMSDPDKAAALLHSKFAKEIKTGLSTKPKLSVTVSLNPGQHTNDNEPLIPAFVTNGQKRIALANNSDDRIVHKTVYVTGKSASSGVLAAKKTNGSGYRVLADSLTYVLTPEDRNILTQGSGFNQKQYHIPPVQSQVPMYLVKSLIGLDKGITQDSTEYSRAFSNVVNIKQQFMIKNSSPSLPMLFTIHLVKIIDKQYGPISLNSVFNRTFYDGADWGDGGSEDLVTLKQGLIPKWFQHTALSQPGDALMRNSSVAVSNKLKSLNMSSNFRAGCEIVESFSKEIPPGDYWNFSHVHRCGSGIDFESVMRSTNQTNENTDISYGVAEDQEYQPFTYGVIFEVRGKTAEAFQVVEGPAMNTYLGSSPTFYSYEYKTSAYFAAESIGDTSNVTAPSTRTYETSSILYDGIDPNFSREKFINQDQISGSVLSLITDNVGKAYVPMSTSTITSTQTHEGGSNPG